MKNLLTVLIALGSAIATAWPSSVAPAAQIPHPAVVRVIAAEPNNVASLGTGVLVAVDQAHGLVVTNWHVVREATGPITVVFPDGFRAEALVLKTDRTWDLAALAIQRPRVQPLPVATEPPRPGEPLSITGYGPDGAYRTVAGRCVKYYKPEGNLDLPPEILEVDVEARRGDSGGPICNSRGEIAGILFGAGGNLLSGGYTMGSYCGRVRQFLAVAYVDFQRLPGNPTLLAQAPAPQASAMTANTTLRPLANNNAAAVTSPPRQVLPETPVFPAEGTAANSPLRPVAKTGPFGAPSASDGKIAANRPNPPALVPPLSNSPVAQVSPATAALQTEPPPSRTDQIKTILAVIGILSILFHGLRFVGSAVG